jgi:hypothetical protein
VQKELEVSLKQQSASSKHKVLSYNPGITKGKNKVQK